MLAVFLSPSVKVNEGDAVDEDAEFYVDMSPQMVQKTAVQPEEYMDMETINHDGQVRVVTVVGVDQGKEH